jgi:hypothetical protein
MSNNNNPAGLDRALTQPTVYRSIAANNNGYSNNHPSYPLVPNSSENNFGRRSSFPYLPNLPLLTIETAPTYPHAPNLHQQHNHEAAQSPGDFTW